MHKIQSGKKQLIGKIKVPGDKSISHRALLFSALAEGKSTITGLLPGADCLATATALRQLGAKIEIKTSSPESADAFVTGTGGVFSQPTKDIDCQNSGTSMRLLCGLLAAQPFNSVLTGDASLSQRPMRRVIDPLTAMGARITTEGQGGGAPLRIEGRALQPIEYQLPVASAQVKSCLLLAALLTDGTTRIVEPTQTRDHTERILPSYGSIVQRHGRELVVTGKQHLSAVDIDVPGDFSSAVFWLVAASIVPDSHLTLSDVGLNSTRTAALKALQRMGATIDISADFDGVEPRGDLLVTANNGLKAIKIAGDEVANLIDEIPILAVAAAFAEGTTEIRDAGELRVKESDRLAAVAKNLQAMGVKVVEHADGLDIVGNGGGLLQSADIETLGDHRIAMAFAVAGLRTDGGCRVDDPDCAAVSYPGFWEKLAELTM